MTLFGYPVAVFSFLLALGLYAGFGSPTPDHIGLAEGLIAITLLLSIRIKHGKAHDYVMATLLYGLSVPTVMAVINGHALSDMVRDIVPFLFLFVPFFYGWIAREYAQDIVICIVVIGIAFSIRTLWVYQDIVLTPSLWGQGAPRDLLYLANSPEVLFSALFCIGKAIYYGIIQCQTRTALGFLLVVPIPLIAMALMMQRAGMGAVVAELLVWGFLLLYYCPKKTGGLFVLLVTIGMAAWPVLGDVIRAMMQKNAVVGLNSRGQEWQAVCDILTHDMPTFLFGEGWGGRLENPAVGGLSVNYTHSFLSSLLLKTGFLGTFICVMGGIVPLFYAIKTRISRFTMEDMVLFLAVIPPFLISATLYASYKSLGFGLILLIFFIFSLRNLEKKQQAVS